MNAMMFLKAAYLIAWVVYLGYLFRMLTRLRTVEKELRELSLGDAPGSSEVGAGIQRQRA